MRDFDEDDLTFLIDIATERISVSEPEQTVAMAVAFMVATDAIGPAAAQRVTLAEFFELFALIFKLITEPDPSE